MLSKETFTKRLAWRLSAAVAELRRRLRTGELSHQQFEAESLAVQRRVAAAAEAAAEAGTQSGGDWIAASIALLQAWPELDDVATRSSVADEQQSAWDEGEEDAEDSEQGDEEEDTGAGAGAAGPYMLLPLSTEVQARVLLAWAVGERARLRVLHEEGHIPGVDEALAEVDEKLTAWLGMVRTNGQETAVSGHEQWETAGSAQGTAAEPAEGKAKAQDPETQLPVEARAVLSAASLRHQQAAVAAAPTDGRLRKLLAARLRNALLRLRRQYIAQLLAYRQYTYECEAVRSMAEAAAQAAADALSSKAGGLQAARAAVRQAWPAQLTSTPPKWLSQALQHAWYEAAKRRRTRTRTLAAKVRAGLISELQQGQAALENGRVFEAEVRQLLHCATPPDPVVTPYSPLQHLWQPVSNARKSSAAAPKTQAKGWTAGRESVGTLQDPPGALQETPSVLQEPPGTLCTTRGALQEPPNPQVKAPKARSRATRGAGREPRPAEGKAVSQSGTGASSPEVVGDRVGKARGRARRAGEAHVSAATGATEGSAEAAPATPAAGAGSAPGAMVMSTRQRHVVASPDMGAKAPKRVRKSKAEGEPGAAKEGRKEKAAGAGAEASVKKPRGRPRKVPATDQGAGEVSAVGAADAVRQRRAPAAATAVPPAAPDASSSPVLSADKVSSWHAESQRSWDAATAAAAHAWLLNGSSSGGTTGAGQPGQPSGTQEDFFHATSACDGDVGFAPGDHAADADEKVQAMLGIIAAMEQQLARLHSVGVLPGQQQRQYEAKVAHCRAAIAAAQLGIQRYVLKRAANSG